jgi:DNA-binding beta-propeller fold protein YncE
MIDMKYFLYRLVILILVTSVLGACATAPKIVKPTKRFFWPPEPDEPRVEWIAMYSSDLDLKVQDGLMTAIVGEDASVEFSRPVFAAGDGDGRFVVTDQGLGQVFMFDLAMRTALPLGGAEGAATFSQPSGVAVDVDGNFYVADNPSRKVFVVNSSNKVVRVLDLSAKAQSIGSIAIDRTRAKLFVPDSKGKQVFVFSLAGDLQSTIDGKGYFSFPNAVAAASDGSIYIADSYNATVLRYSAEGKYLSAIGKRGDSPGNLTLVTGVAVDSEDHVYVTDGRLHNVTIFDKDANTLLVFGAQHSVKTGNIGRGGFQIPQGISIDKNDRIYVADSFNLRVQVFQYLNKRYLAEHPLTPTKP